MITFYFIGVWTVFVILFIFLAWALVNEKKLDKEIDLLNAVLNLVIYPFFSWMFILFIVLTLLSKYIKGVNK